jgi:hypothetical protein
MFASLLSIALLSPVGVPPTFSFVQNTGPLWYEDESWSLVAPDWCVATLGLQMEVERLGQGLDEDHSIGSMWRRVLGRPYVISLFVDVNKLSYADLEKTMNKIRSGWKTTRKVHFVFRLAWLQG